MSVQLWYAYIKVPPQPEEAKKGKKGKKKRTCRCDSCMPPSNYILHDYLYTWKRRRPWSLMQKGRCMIRISLYLAIVCTLRQLPPLQHRSCIDFLYFFFARADSTLFFRDSNTNVCQVLAKRGKKRSTRNVSALAIPFVCFFVQL